MFDDQRGFVVFYLQIWVCILLAWMLRKYWKEVHFLILYNLCILHIWFTF